MKVAPRVLDQLSNEEIANQPGVGVSTVEGDMRKNLRMVETAALYRRVNRRVIR